VKGLLAYPRLMLSSRRADEDNVGGEPALPFARERSD